MFCVHIPIRELYGNQSKDKGMFKSEAHKCRHWFNVTEIYCNDDITKA